MEERSCLLNALVGERQLPNSVTIGRRGSLRQQRVVVSFLVNRKEGSYDIEFFI